MFAIEPANCSDNEYETIAAIHNAVWPHNPHTANEWRHNDQDHDPRYLLKRFIIWHDSVIVGFIEFGDMFWSSEKEKLFADITVHPDWQGQGLGRKSAEWLYPVLLSHTPKYLAAQTLDNQPRAVALLHKFGFQQTLREPMSSMAVQTFDPTPYLGLEQKLADEDIIIRTLTDLKRLDPDYERHMWLFKSTLMEDVPSDAPPERLPLELWLKYQLHDPALDPDGWLVAEDSSLPRPDCYVGLSHLWTREATRDILKVGLTGVKRGYRRRGIATALKVRGWMFAKAYGAQEIITDNEENNPMYDLNLRLGFRPKPARLKFKKVL